MALYVRKVQLSPAIRMGHVTALEKTSCKYPIRRVEVKVDTVPTGNMNYVQDNAFGTAAKETRHCLCRQRCSERHYWEKSIRFQTLQDQFCGTPRWRTTDSSQTITARLRKRWLHPKLYGTLHQYRKNVSRRKKYHFQRRLCQRKHLVWIWSHTRHVWSWSLSAYKTRQLESGDSFRRSPYSNHQRDHVCRIWQRHWNW